MAAEVVAVAGIEDDLLYLFTDDAYAHVDPLSDHSYLFDPHKYARHDDSLETSRHALGAD